MQFINSIPLWSMVGANACRCFVSSSEENGCFRLSEMGILEYHKYLVEHIVPIFTFTWEWLCLRVRGMLSRQFC